MIFAPSCSLKKCWGITATKTGLWHLVIFIKTMYKDKKLSLSFGFLNTCLTDISLSDVKVHLPEFCRHFGTLLHSEKITRKLLEYRSSHELQRVQWSIVEENIIYITYRGEVKSFRARHLREPLLTSGSWSLICPLGSKLSLSRMLVIPKSMSLGSFCSPLCKI